MSERTTSNIEIGGTSLNQRIYMAATSHNTPPELRMAIARTYQSKRTNLDNL